MEAVQPQTEPTPIPPQRGAGTMREIERIFQKQRAHRWRMAQTTAEERIARLKKIRDAIFARREELQEAIHNDFRKHPQESDITEIYPVIAEINHTIAHLAEWMKPQKVKTPLVLFGTRSEVRYEPRGSVLLLSPWNYPFQLFMVPLVTAISAGNCVMAKASTKVPHTASFLKDFVSQIFDESEVAVVEGDHSVADALLEMPFDHIFFTGSPPIGRKVMAAAAKNLATVTLELGGKSPAIVDATADLQKAAERIMWGKFINAGQTCVAPDYLLLEESRLEEFVDRAKKVLEKRYGESEEDRKRSPDYCRLVSRGALDGLKRLLEESVQAGAKVEVGGEVDREERYFSPTLLSNVASDSPIMKEEIFGPILPILTFQSIEEAIEIIRGLEKPLALYIFSESRAVVERFLRGTTAGGSCVNSLIIHLGNSHLPFGGVGMSGMGNYHGFYGFRNLSHERAVLHQGPIDMLQFFYPPYGRRVKQMIEAVMRFFA